jgi:hypothetical protein
MTDLVDVPNLTPKQQAMLAVWQQHTYAEFALKDPGRGSRRDDREPVCV